MEFENEIEDNNIEIQTATHDKEPILARIISMVLHPMFMAIYGIALLFVYTDFKYIFGNQFFRFMLPVVLFSCLIPATSIFFLKRVGIIGDLSLKEKEDRFLPLLIALLSYGLLFYYFFKAGLYTWFLSAIIAPMILLLLSAFISKYWKISAHMVAIGGLIGTVLSVCYNIKGQNPYTLFIILIILAGALGVSRIVLKRHTPAQVYAGFLLGAFVSYFCVLAGGYFPYLLLLFH